MNITYAFRVWEGSRDTISCTTDFVVEWTGATEERLRRQNLYYKEDTFEGYQTYNGAIVARRGPVTKTDWPSLDSSAGNCASTLAIAEYLLTVNDAGWRLTSLHGSSSSGDDGGINPKRGDDRETHS
jgi:hypothetical protein